MSVSTQTDDSDTIVVSDFAELEKGTFVNTQFVADAFNVTPRTVRRMINRYELPPPITFGNRSGWFVEHLLDYFDRISEYHIEEAENERRRIEQMN